MLKVLVVEDHDDTRELISTFLQRWGFVVRSAEGLEAGLKIVQDEPFDAIVSDIGLRDGSGYALVAAAKRQRPGLTAIAMSAYGSNEDVLLGKVAGFDHHLVKPFDPLELRNVLESLGTAV